MTNCPYCGIDIDELAARGFLGHACNKMPVEPAKRELERAWERLDIAACYFVSNRQAPSACRRAFQRAAIEFVAQLQEYAPDGMYEISDLVDILEELLP